MDAWNDKINYIEIFLITFFSVFMSDVIDSIISRIPAIEWTIKIASNRCKTKLHELMGIQLLSAIWMLQKAALKIAAKQQSTLG